MDRAGDDVGYIVLELGPMGDWGQATFPHVASVGQAVSILERFQDAHPDHTYAVAALKLSMISRSDGKA